MVEEGLIASFKRSAGVVLEVGSSRSFSTFPKEEQILGMASLKLKTSGRVS